MQKHRRLIGLRQLLDEDLDAVCADLTAEFGAMSGGRLLVTGGGGFLGYYLVQSVLHWNDTRAAGAKIDLAVYDNYARGVPEWLEALRGRPDLQLRRHDMIEPLPKDIGHFDYIIHAAGIASPIYYRAQPLKCIDANINGLRNLLDYAVAERDARPSVARLPVLLVQRDLRRPRRRRRSRRPRPIGATCPAPARGRATTSPSASARRCASSMRSRKESRCAWRGRSTTTARD